jgi:hypothetical protein
MHRGRRATVCGPEESNQESIVGRIIPDLSLPPPAIDLEFRLARSSSRLGHGPLKAGARVRVPYALPSHWPMCGLAPFRRKTASRAAWRAIERSRKKTKTGLNAYQARGAERGAIPAFFASYARSGSPEGWCGVKLQALAKGLLGSASIRAASIAAVICPSNGQAFCRRSQSAFGPSALFSSNLPVLASTPTSCVTPPFLMSKE